MLTDMRHKAWEIFWQWITGPSKEPLKTAVGFLFSDRLTLVFYQSRSEDGRINLNWQWTKCHWVNALQKAACLESWSPLSRRGLSGNVRSARCCAGLGQVVAVCSTLKSRLLHRPFPSAGSWCLQRNSVASLKSMKKMESPGVALSNEANETKVNVFPASPPTTHSHPPLQPPSTSAQEQVCMSFLIHIATLYHPSSCLYRLQRTFTPLKKNLCHLSKNIAWPSRLM